MLFDDRDEAGRLLGRALSAYRGQDVIVLGIPRGGVAVAYHIALALRAPLDAMVVRKIPVPWDTEAGFGAVGPDGSVYLNQEIAPYLGLPTQEVERLTAAVYGEVQRRMRLYRGLRPWPSFKGKTVILADDGLATGITMLAALKSVRSQEPTQIVVASPVASASGYDLVRPHANEVVCLHIHPAGHSFAVASFYRRWTDMSDEEVVEYLSRPTIFPSNGGRGPAS